MKIKGVLFDLDGTLLDTSKGILLALQDTLKEVGLPPYKKEDENFFIGPPIQKTLKIYYQLDETKAMEIANIFRNRYKTHEYLLKADHYPEIIPLIKELKSRGIKVGVATYKREDYATDILKEFDLYDLFDVVKGSDFEGKLSKADIIKICIDELNIKPEETILLGDTNSDLEGAQIANSKFVGVTYGFGYKKIDDLAINNIVIGMINHPLELLEIIK